MDLPHAVRTDRGDRHASGSEAMGIERDDVDLDTGVLTVRLPKFGKSRLVPLPHPTTSAALRSYANRRDGHLGLRCGSTFFVAEKGGRLLHQYVPSRLLAPVPRDRAARRHRRSCRATRA